MSVIDNWVDGNTKSIPTEYNGQMYKSRLEAKVAKFLDENATEFKDGQLVKVEIQYEPKNFLLENGLDYCPDFYLPQLNLWIEVKGSMPEGSRSEQQINGFCKQIDKMPGAKYLVITPKHAWLYKYHDLRAGLCNRWNYLYGGPKD
jgi:hypothetical protein